ncbi:flagellin [Paenibacillus sp. N1-5-1-14]|uniref:flagellin N-terminal helical domain-containing protein n=1 Tax=Paenibacillus radicibacter TaxID=2972488 RepID=UPI0021592061|nr:flagellin [Paenibacillus radicibacter]MCR8644569.1 flagellin [Paenibacillus radicibacter]
MIISHNLTALNANNMLQKNSKSTSNSIEKLSSGLRINKAADDAAGLSISEKMRAQIKGLNQAGRNVQDAISLIQTAEGGYQEITDMLQRKRELLIQSMNDTYTLDDRSKIDEEIQQLKQEINSITNRTEFNTINLLARDDYQILADRSIHTVKTTTTGPFPPQRTDYESFTHFLPSGTIEVPRTTQTSQTQTTTDDVYTTTSNRTPITSPDGREGYNHYEKNEHIHTETTTTDEYTFERLLQSDPRYKELAVKNIGNVSNVFFQTSLIPTGITVGQYPDFGGFEDRFISVDVDGVSTSLDQFTLVSSSITANGITATYEKDGIQLEKVISTDGSAFTAKFKITNNSGIDNRTINISAGFQPMYDGQYAITSPNGGTDFALSNELVDYDFSVLSGGTYTQPNAVQIPATGNLTSHKVPGSQMRLSWGDANNNNGDVMEFGIQLSNFNIKKDVYRVTNETTSKVDAVVQTVTTDITDIDYIPPGLQIQAGANSGQSFRIPLFQANTDGLGITNVGVMPPANPTQSLNQVEQALSTVTKYRSIYGALQNRMEHALSNADNTANQLTAAESRIRDANIAKEMVDLTKLNILTQAAQSMLAQANQKPQAVLQLLK